MELLSSLFNREKDTKKTITHVLRIFISNELATELIEVNQSPQKYLFCKTMFHKSIQGKD